MPSPLWLAWLPVATALLRRGREAQPYRGLAKASTLCAVLDQPHSQRHLEAAARHEEAAAHHDALAARFDDAGDPELAELERRGAAYAREGAALERDRAAIFKARGQ